MHPARDGDRSAQMRPTSESAARACAVAVRHGAAVQAPLAASRARVRCSLDGLRCWCQVAWVPGCDHALSEDEAEVRSSQPTAELVDGALNSAHGADVSRRTLSTALLTRVPVQVVGTLGRRGHTAALSSPLPHRNRNLGSPLPHLRQDWAQPCPPSSFCRDSPLHLTAATSAPGLGSPLPHLRLSHTHTHMHAPTQTNAHTRAHTRARGCACAHTHTPCRAARSACPRRQPLSEFAAGGKCVCCNIPCCTLHVARCTFQVVWCWCDRFGVCASKRNFVRTNSQGDARAQA